MNSATDTNNNQNALRSVLNNYQYGFQEKGKNYLEGHIGDILKEMNNKTPNQKHFMLLINEREILR